MTRIAVIGNSHIGALKLGWDEVRDAHPDIEIRFFGMPKAFAPFCRLSDDLDYGLDAARAPEKAMRQAEEINGAPGIALADCELVLHAGHELPLPRFLGLAKEFAVEELLERAADRRLSRAAFEAVADEILEDHLPGPGWRGWAPPRPRQMLALKPAVSEGVRGEAKRREFPFWAEWVDHNDRLVPFFSLIVARFAARLEAIGFGFLPQPAATLTEDGLTVERFSRESRRLYAGRSHDEDDVTHMNAAYGALVLEELFRTCAVPA